VQGCSGELRALQIAHLPHALHAAAKDASVAVRVEGGRWDLEEVSLYAMRGTALVATVGGAVRLSWCDIGGLGESEDRARHAIQV
jgi:hypothetical protein